MNIILIGMPACGKSTVGVILAKRLGMGFIDADLVIQAQNGMLLQEIIDEKGEDAFFKAEQAALTSIQCDRCVIATGGSAVYSERGMEHLKQNGVLVYINLSIDEIERRLTNLSVRGVVGAADKSLAELYKERTPLYEKYADITIDADGLSTEDVIVAISKAVAEI